VPSILGGKGIGTSGGDASEHILGGGSWIGVGRGGSRAAWMGATGMSLFLLGTTNLHGEKGQFRFDTGLLHRDGFVDMVKDVWNRPVTGDSPPIQRWNNEIRKLQKHLQGWERHTTCIYEKEKKKAITDQ
jgi:hypothetical protein